MDYFDARGITNDFYKNYRLPFYISQLPQSAKILDFGCGFGQTLLKLEETGFKNLYGVDINKKSLDTIQSAVIKKKAITSFTETADENFKSFDFIILSHVLEHFPKDDIIPFLKYCFTDLLSANGSLIIAVPNAQSFTGAYWAYEDFTHNTLFTAGSLYYVLKNAGFEKIEFIDIDGTHESTFIKKIIKKALLGMYKQRIRFWNFVTNSSFHKPSPQIFSYEIKALATKK